MEFKRIVSVNMKAHIPLDSHYMVYNVTAMDTSLWRMPCSESVWGSVRDLDCRIRLGPQMEFYWSMYWGLLTWCGRPESCRRFSSQLHKPPKTAAALQVLTSCECLTGTDRETSPNLVSLRPISSSFGYDTVHKWRLRVDPPLTATTLFTEQGGSFP